MTRKAGLLFTNLFVLLILSVFSWNSLAYSNPSSGYVYMSPKPGAEYVSAEQTILIRPTNGFQVGAESLLDFTVTGSESGQINGEVLLVDDNQAALFKPTSQFVPGETVHIEVQGGIADGFGGILEGLSYSFDVSGNEIRPANVCRADKHTASPLGQTGNASAKYQTVPEGVPQISATVWPTETNTAEGYLFFAPFNWDQPQNSTPYLLMVDDTGELIFYRELPAGTPATDFKKQPNGLLTYFDSRNNCYKGLDNNYKWVETFEAGNGYLTDNHELLILPNGNYVLMVYDPQPVDGYEVPVEGLVLQELDPAGNVIFQWRSWDHFKITDATIDISVPGRRGTIDYVHGNSIEVDTDGNWLVSSRHIDEITKIDRNTGDVIWRFGGRNNEFELSISLALFERQHDARRLPNGNLSVFDNSGYGAARVLEYELDEVAKTAKEVSEIGYGHSIAMGNAQWLPNGNKLVGWGSDDEFAATEFGPEGELLIEFYFMRNRAMFENQVSYRAFRFPWEGKPESPKIALDPKEQKLYFSSNGTTDPSGENYLYEIWGGVDKASSSLIASQVRTGFEDELDVSPWPSFNYYQVVLVDQRTNDRYMGEITFSQLFVPFLQIPSQTKIPPTDPIFWLPLDDGPGAEQFKDGERPSVARGKCYDQSCPSMVSEGVRNRAFKFEEDDFIVVDGENPIRTTYTFEAWVNTTSTTVWSGIMATESYSSSWAQMALSPSGNLRVELMEDPYKRIRKLYDGKTALNDGEWHHVAFTFDVKTNELLLYVDGQLEVASALVDHELSQIRLTDNILIGTTRDREVFFDGLIDEVVYYERVLSPAEIEERYASFDIN